MSPELPEIERQALALPVKDRAALAEHLIASLDEIPLNELESMWVNEADKRYQEYLAGNLPSKQMSQVMQDARKRLAFPRQCGC